MNLIEKKQNLFTISDDYYFAHCISSDYALGAGIAVEFQKRFRLKQKLFLQGNGSYPDCIMIGKVFNLVTKAKYWNKPTYGSLQASLEMMKELVVQNDISKIAMPKIGCGLDRLQWGRVREILNETFKDIDIEIVVCSL